MYTRFLVALTLLTAFFSCKNDTNSAAATGNQSANANNLAGQWIAIDFCSRANQYGSVLQAETYGHKPYAYAFDFNPTQPDSVICYNGAESWKLPVKINQDTLELPGAVQGKSIFLVYDSQGEKNLIMFDNTGGSAQMDKFIKSKVGSPNAYEAFLVALKHALFSGSFSLPAKGAADKIVFAPSGNIQGWKDYDRYTVCAGGDCFVMGNEMDIMRLFNSKNENSERMVGFKYSAQNDTLSLLNLVDATPGEKGGYAVKNVAYTFLHKLPK